MDEDSVGDASASDANRVSSGSKRNVGDLDDNEDHDIFSSKKSRTEVEEAANAMISSLRESLQGSKDELASCQTELESAKAEIHKWKSAFQKESFIPHGKSPEPGYLIDHIQSLKSSEKALKEQVEIAQMKLAIRDLRDELKLKAAPVERLTTDGDPETGSEQGSHNEIQVDKSLGGYTCTSCTSRPRMLDEVRAAKADAENTLETQLRNLETQLKEMQEEVKFYERSFEYLASKDPQLRRMMDERAQHKASAEKEHDAQLSDNAEN